MRNTLVIILVIGVFYVTTAITAINRPFTCPNKEGEYADISNCSRYYHCSDWTAYSKDCSVGLYWDIEAGRCNYPDQTNCDPNKPFRCPLKDGTFADANTCEGFYSCRRNRATYHKCPNGLHFNARDGTCDWPQYAVCQTKPNPKICDSPNIKTFDERNCNCYFECDEELRPTAKCCNSGQLWNQFENSCGDPLFVDCFNYRTKRSTSPNLYNETGILSPTGQSSAFTCPPAPDPYLYPNSTDCTKFIACSNGIPYSMNCPAGLHFNPSLQVCDYPANAGCNVATTTQPITTTTAPTTTTTTTTTAPTTTTTTTAPTTTTTTTTTAPTTTTTTTAPTTTTTTTTTTPPTTTTTTQPTTTTPTTVAPTTQSNPSAPVVCENVGDYIRDPANCSCYYQCDNFNRPAYFCCPDNLLFNPNLNVCDWPENVVCNNTEAPPVVSTTETPTASQTSQTQTTPLATVTTTQSVSSTSSAPQPPEDAPEEGITSAQPITQTTPQSVSSTQPSEEAPVPCVTDDFQCPKLSDPTACNGPKDCLYPYAPDCTQYIQCDASGTKFIRQCANETATTRLRFDNNTKECNWSANVDCNQCQPPEEAPEEDTEGPDTPTPLPVTQTSPPTTGSTSPPEQTTTQSNPSTTSPPENVETTTVSQTSTASPVPPEEAPEEGETSNEPDTTTAQSVTSTQPSEEAPQPCEDTFICPKLSDPTACNGPEDCLYPYAPDCTQYIQCDASGTKFIRQCANETATTRLRFDNSTKQCNWTSNVECNQCPPSEEAPEEDTEEPGTTTIQSVTQTSPQSVSSTSPTEGVPGGETTTQSNPSTTSPPENGETTTVSQTSTTSPVPPEEAPEEGETSNEPDTTTAQSVSSTQPSEEAPEPCEDTFICPKLSDPTACNGPTDCLYPYAPDCTQYIQCDASGTKFIRQCANETATTRLRFDNSTKQCNWTSNVECNQCPPSEEAPEDDTEAPDTTTTQSVTQTNPQSSSTASTPEEAPGGETTTQATQSTTSSPENGETTTVSQTSTTSAVPPEEAPEEETSEVTDTTTAQSVTSTQPSEEAPEPCEDTFICPKLSDPTACNGPTDCLYPYAPDCTQYIQCDASGTKFIRQCANETATTRLRFDNSTKQCNWTSNVECNQCPPPEETPEEDTEEPDTTTAQSVPQTSPQSVSSTSPTEGAPDEETTTQANQPTTSPPENEETTTVSQTSTASPVPPEEAPEEETSEVPDTTTAPSVSSTPPSEEAPEPCEDTFICPKLSDPTACNGPTDCLYPYAPDCTQYIQCDASGTKFIRQCANETATTRLRFDNSTKQCNWTSNVECNQCPPPEEAPEEDTEEPDTTTIQSVTQTSPQTSSSPSPPEEGPGEETTTQANQPTTGPPENVETTTVSQTSTTSPVPPEEAPEEDETSEEPDTTTAQSVTSTQPSEEAPQPCEDTFICPKLSDPTACNGPTDCLYPYAPDCTQYIQCDASGTKFIRQCANETATTRLRFDNSTKQCNWTSNVECNQCPPPEEAPEEDTEEPDTTTVQPVTQTSPTSPPEEAPGGETTTQADQPTGPPENVETTTVTQTSTASPTPPEEAPEEETSEEPDTTTSQSTSSTSPPEEAPETTTLPAEEAPPAETTTQSNPTEPPPSCTTPPPEEELDLTELCNANCSVAYTVPYPNNTARYVLCNGNNVSAQQCSPGLIYDQNRLTCDYIGLVDPPTTTAASHSHETRRDDVCIESNGIYQDRDDCRFAFRCVDFVAQRIRCPNGLMFNELISNCDLAANVNCFDGSNRRNRRRKRFSRY